MSTSDHELMRRCGEGDAAAFEMLVRRWEGRVGRVLRRLTANACDAEDLQQETFVRVLLASPRYRANGAFSTWLYRIALNLARDAARRRQRVAMPGSHDTLDTKAGPRSETERAERREVVEQSLQVLPPGLREVLVLRHYGDLTFARISEVLGEPESTIKSRTKTALEKLHAELRRRGITNGDLQ